MKGSVLMRKSKEEIQKQIDSLCRDAEGILDQKALTFLLGNMTLKGEISLDDIAVFWGQLVYNPKFDTTLGKPK